MFCCMAVPGGGLAVYCRDVVAGGGAGTFLCLQLSPQAAGRRMRALRLLQEKLLSTELLLLFSWVLAGKGLLYALLLVSSFMEFRIIS